MKALWLALALLAGAPAHAADRIVSLNLCSDQLLVLLAPERVAALSSLARDPTLSFVADRAAALPQVRADAEAVLRLHPDLVLAGRYGAQATLAMLEAGGLRILRLEQPRSFDGIRAQVRELAAVLGVPDRGEALVAEMEARLAALPRRPQPIRALLWQPRGWTGGPGTLGDAVLRAAGLANAGSGGQVGVEALLARPPDLLVTATAPSYPSLATDMLRHPALAGLPRRTVPPALLICGGPFTARAAELLAR